MYFSISFPVKGIFTKHYYTAQDYQNQVKLYPKVFKLMARIARLSFLPFGEEQEKPDAWMTLQRWSVLSALQIWHCFILAQAACRPRGKVRRRV